jgi:hypothetical protein
MMGIQFGVYEFMKKYLLKKRALSEALYSTQAGDAHNIPPAVVEDKLVEGQALLARHLPTHTSADGNSVCVENLFITEKAPSFAAVGVEDADRKSTHSADETKLE